MIFNFLKLIYSNNDRYQQLIYPHLDRHFKNYKQSRHSAFIKIKINYLALFKYQK
ncbi:hypothetical protein PPRY_a2192 [Pseudoalteromonas prydzensis ACAM 620]|nr:hypothetical protein [Pseudoalteromonas prydzensis ACAM 620]